MKTPDHVLLRYVELSLALGAPLAQDPAAMKGVLRAAECAKCGGKIARDFEEASRSVLRCANASCHAAWPMVAVIVPRGVIQSSPRRGAMEDRLAALATVGQLLKGVTRWQWAAWSAYLLGRVGGYVAIADYGRKHWPDAPWDWTSWRVRSLIDSGRRTTQENIDSGTT